MIANERAEKKKDQRNKEVADYTNEEKATTREDDWGLSMDFHLFAQHEEFAVPLPNAKVLKLLCVESLTPLDMMHLGSGIHDATGHCAWTASFLFLRMIPMIQDQFQCFHGKRVLELGCGTGIGGLAVALVTNTAHVELTDHDPQVLELCQRNCELNLPPKALLSTATTASSSWAVRQLTWGCGEEEEGSRPSMVFDTVLATDVLYDISKLKPLLQSAYSALSSSSETTTTSRLIFVLSHVPRACYNKEHPPVEDLDKYIAEMANECGFSLQRVYRPCEVEEEGKTSPQTEPTTSVLKDSLSLKEMEEIGASIFIFQK
jgi:predicted nicotinamide N-methyase